MVSAPSLDGDWNGYVLLSVAAALFTGSVTVNLRRLAALDIPRTIMLWQSAILLLILAAPAALAWTLAHAYAAGADGRHGAAGGRSAMDLDQAL